MKLQVQTWQSADGFLLSVNTHDQVLALDPKSADAPAFRALQAENQRIKERIESAWEVAKLPTEYQTAYAKHFAGANTDPGRWDKFRDSAWKLMANTPENYYKKVLYNSELRRLTADGMTPFEAHWEAWGKVEATLFRLLQDQRH